MSPLILQSLMLQAGLPLLLIVLHAWVRPASFTGWLLRVIAIALLLLLAARIGLWLFPPWWTPWLLGVLHVVASAIALRRWQGLRSPPSSRRRMIEMASATLLSAAAIALLVPGFEGRRAPDGAVSLASPLAPGDYLVTSGGASRAVNAHLMTLTGERFKAFRGQSYAVDLIGLNRWGFRASGVLPVAPADYVIYGRPVVAPCTGTVAVALDGVIDMPVPVMDREHMLGNHVILKCQAFFVVLAHLAPGSIVVAQNDSVRSGDSLGAVGNTGNSGEPHLHLHVQATLPPGQPISGEPLWFTLNERFLVRNDRLHIPE